MTTVAAPGEVACEVCGRWCKSVGLGAHMRSHGVRATTPGRAPVYGAKDQPVVCPECGEAQTNPAGLGAHRRYRHGVAGTSRGTVMGKGRAAQSVRSREREALTKLRAHLGREHAALAPILEPTGSWRALCACGANFRHRHRFAAVDALLEHVGSIVPVQEQEPA